MQDSIKLEYVDRNITYNGEINREEFLSHMQHLKETFSPQDNQISTKLVELIPNMVSIRINNDVNETQNIPYIWYVTTETEGILKIRRCHHIVWAFLNYYCDKIKNWISNKKGDPEVKIWVSLHKTLDN